MKALALRRFVEWNKDDGREMTEPVIVFAFLPSDDHYAVAIAATPDHYIMVVPVDALRWSETATDWPTTPEFLGRADLR